MFRVRFQGPALLPGQLDPPIAVGRLAAHIFPFPHRGGPSALEAAVDGAVLPPGHEQPELKVFLVGGVGRVVDLGGGDDLGAGKLEGAGHDALVDGVAPCQTLHLHHQDAVAGTLLHLGQEELHLGAGGDAVAGHHLLIHLPHLVAPAGGQGEEGVPVAFEGVLLAAGFQLQVGPGFPQIDVDGHGITSLHIYRPGSGFRPCHEKTSFGVHLPKPTQRRYNSLA